MGHIQTKNTDFLPLMEGRDESAGFCYFAFSHQLIEWIQVDHTRLLFLIIVCVSFIIRRRSTQQTPHTIDL